MAIQEHGRVHHFPVEDLTFDVLTIVHEKSKALEAYDKYIEDARRDPAVAALLRDIRDEDELHVERLQHHLARLLAHDVASDGASGEELPRSVETAPSPMAGAHAGDRPLGDEGIAYERPLDDDGGDADGE